MPTLLIALSSLLLSNASGGAWPDLGHAAANEAVVEEPILLIVHEPVLRLYVHAASSSPADARNPLAALPR